jgi:hypothetical protein
MGLVNEYRLNELGQFLEISASRATAEYRSFLLDLIFSKLDSNKSSAQFDLYCIGADELEIAEIPLLYQICLSVGITQDTLDYVPYKFHIAVGENLDATFDFRDMEMMDSKSESMMMTTLIRELNIPPIDPTLVRFKKTMPVHYQNSFLLLCNDPDNGSYCKYFSIQHPDYNKILSKFG